MLIKCCCYINIQQGIASTSKHSSHPVLPLCPLSEPDLHINTTIHIHSTLQIVHLLCIFRLLSSRWQPFIKIFFFFLNFFFGYVIFSSYCSYGIIREWAIILWRIYWQRFHYTENIIKHTSIYKSWKHGRTSARNEIVKLYSEDVKWWW